MSKHFRGYVINFSPDIFQYVSFNFHEEEFRNRHWRVRPYDTVIDIGVDFGPYTLTALAQGASHVYCVEPRESSLERLVKNIELNVGFSDRVTIIPKFASDYSDQNTNTITVDSIVEQFDIEKLNWLKIDVEGMENKVLFGAENTLTEHKPKIFLENHNKLNEEQNDKYLNELGYQLIDRNKELIPNLYTYNTQSIYHYMRYRKIY